MHCQDEQACQGAREQAEPLWFDSQHRGWHVSWEKYREALAAQQQYAGGIYNPGFKPYYQLTGPDEELSARDYAAG
jgi:hypothetical protein